MAPCTVDLDVHESGSFKMSSSEHDTDAPIAELRRAVAAARPAGTAADSAPARSRIRGDGAVDQTVVAFNVFANLLASDGIRSALYSVLRKSDYRFISIFRFQDGRATSAVHVDREDLSVVQADEVADTATYCCYVRDANGSFVTADASTDLRTAGHVARDAVRAYCGIPILEPDGELIGTLCHYDLVPRDPEQLDLHLLLQVSSALAQSGLIPPYPPRG
jgi:hypothetical protein